MSAAKEITSDDVKYFKYEGRSLLELLRLDGNDYDFRIKILWNIRDIPYKMKRRKKGLGCKTRLGSVDISKKNKKMVVSKFLAKRKGYYQNGILY